MASELIDGVYTSSQLPLQSAIDVHVSDYRMTPWLVERLLGMLLFGIAFPVIVLLVGLVRLTSAGPGLYRQARVGRHGRIFTMLKIRTMTVDAETQTGPQWTRVNDPRITRLGWLLRKTHLDELPQLWNVACGDMAIMGPRPERPELIHVLADHVPGYLNRLAVQPGITGLAQINLPPDTDLESVRRKLVLDLEYVETANWWLDARMFVWTTLRLFGCPAGWATRWMGLNRTVAPSINACNETPITIAAILASDRMQREARVEEVETPLLDAEEGVDLRMWHGSGARA